jgi:hypothetical protein
MVDGHRGGKFQVAGKTPQVVQARLAFATGEIVFVFIFQYAISTGIRAIHSRDPFRLAVSDAALHAHRQTPPEPFCSILLPHRN